MPDKEHDATGARGQILKDSFRRVTMEEATILVGILFANRFVLRAETWNPTTHKQQARLVEVQPLDPQAASILVGDVLAWTAIICSYAFNKTGDR